MAKFIAERPALIERMEQQQILAKEGGSRSDEILQYLVDKHHPTWRELRKVRSAGTLDNYIPVGEKTLLSDQNTRREINQYNRSQRLVQEIGATKEDWNTLNGKRTVWVYILLLGQHARAMRPRYAAIVQGGQRKLLRVDDAIRNSAKRRRAADSIRKSVEAAIRRGRRGTGA
jgi:hypothetical protein